jgi:hypothetical protein
LRGLPASAATLTALTTATTSSAGPAQANARPAESASEGWTSAAAPSATALTACSASTLTAALPGNLHRQAHAHYVFFVRIGLSGSNPVRSAPLKTQHLRAIQNRARVADETVAVFGSDGDAAIKTGFEVKRSATWILLDELLNIVSGLNHHFFSRTRS